MKLQETMRRSWLVIALVAGLLTACASDGSSDGASPGGAPTGTAAAGDDGCTGPIKIGMLNPTSGVYAPIGEDIQRGFDLYVEQNGGNLGGREVELLIRDTEVNPEVAVRAANELVDEGVEFVTGIFSSAVALAVVDPLSEAEVPMVVSNATSPALTAEGHSPYLFRVSISSWQNSYPAGQWVVENWTDSGIYVSAPDYAAGHAYAEGFVAGVEDAGGTIAGQQLPAFAQTQDYQPYLAEIQNANAEAVLAFYGGSEAVSFVNQYDDFGLKENVPLLGAISLISDEVLDAQGDSAVGVHAAAPWFHAMDNPTNSEFVAAYEETFPDATMGYASVFAYDAAQLIDIALTQTEGCSDDVDALISAMEGAELDSPRGTLEIDPETHGTVQNLYIVEVQDVDGELTHVEVADLGRWGEQPGSGPTD